MSSLVWGGRLQREKQQHGISVNTNQERQGELCWSGYSSCHKQMFSMLCRSENKQIHVQGVGAMKSCYFSIVPKTFCFVHLKKRS